MTDTGMSDVEARYRAILAGDPASQEALYQLGLLAAQKGRRQEAYDLLKRAADTDSIPVGLLAALGRAAALLDRDDEAQGCFARALQMDASDVAALAGLGALFYKQGKLDQAFDSLRKAVALAPERIDVRSNLAGVHLRRGAFAEAETELRAAFVHAPDNPGLHNSLGVVLMARGRYAEAEESLRAALSLAEDHAEARCNLGIVLSQTKRFDQAIPQFRAVLARQPDHQGALAGLAAAYQTFNMTAEARAAYAEVIRRNRRHWWARWGLLTALPILYRTDSEIAAARRAFDVDLAALEDDVPRHVATDHAAMVLAVASRTNFFLHYQGENDRDLQSRYGALVTKIAETAFPRFAQPLTPRVLAPGERIRVGFASGFLRNHSVTKTHGAWITGLRRDRFEVSLFHLSAVSDGMTERLKQDSRYHDCARLSSAALADTIARENLDVLIWLDIGMEGRTQIPAALHLAPVQASCGGHPVTSGLPAIDYYLSSALMEPADGDAHYTETLVRLPHLAACYPMPPADGGKPPAILEALREKGGVIYLCSQSLYKLLPRHDAIYAAVLRAVPEAQLLFIASREPAITDCFRDRMAAALAQTGVAVDRLHFVPNMAQRDFYALNRSIDVILDSFTWSGDNSTFEALAFDRPVVTLPGANQRSRHSAAILTRLGMSELIARDVEDYVAIAARLGRDPSWRARVMQTIAARKAVLFDDREPVTALAAWLEQRVARRF